MVHIFRIFENTQGDYLEFIDKSEVVESYYQQRNSMQYDWRTVPIQEALSAEESLLSNQALRTMKQRGAKHVVMTVTQGKTEWFSPVSDNAAGIPSEYSIAVRFFTDQAKYFKVTTKHHEVFKVAQDPRYKVVCQKVIKGILHRVAKTQCERRLDKYVDLNLGKLKKYGIQLDLIEGSYSHIKQTVEGKGISCPVFGSFFTELMDVCIKKEAELLGENRVHEKTIL